MKKIISVIFALFILTSSVPNLFFRNKKTGNMLHALNFTDVNTALTDIFYIFTDPNEATTSFRSLLIPFGGRAESLGNAYTGLSDDISFLNSNPAASSLLAETQFAVFHNAWIADSKMETIAYSTRHKNLGFGVQASCFYMPFTEYNIFGSRTGGNYYTETTGAVNISYNFLAGYDFKGIALGMNLKAGWRGMPDYADNDTNAVIQNSGIAQSALGLMADAGLLLQFNLLKFYSSREPNLRIGFSARNLGVALTGFTSQKGVRLDDGLPSSFTAGLSLTLIKPLTLTLDFKQPVNLMDMQNYIFPSVSSGIVINFTTFLALLGGFEIKGGNPRFSAGAEFQFSKIRFNFNYTLDLSTSLNPINRISLCGRIMLGDKGRSLIDNKIDEYYINGLAYYSDGDWEKAIDEWNKILVLNERYDPAILGIKSARAQINMFQHIKDSLLLEQE